MGFMFSKDSTADEVELESRVRDDVPSINDVLRFIGLGRFHYFLLVACHVVLFLGFQEIMDIAFTIPHVECDIEVPEHIGRFARGASFFGALAMSLPWGFLVDTWGRVNVLRISLPIMCVSNVMCGLTVNSSSLALSRFFLGVGVSGVVVATLIYMGDFYTQRHQQFFVLLALSGFPLAELYKASLAHLLLQLDFRVPIVRGLELTPWRVYILISVPLTVIISVVCMLLPQSPKFQLMMGEKEKAIECLRRIYVINTHCPADTFPVTDVTCRSMNSGRHVCKMGSLSGVFWLFWDQTCTLFQRPYLWRMLFSMYASFVIFFVSDGIYMAIPDALEFYLANKHEKTVCAAIDAELIGTVSKMCQSNCLEKIRWNYVIGDFNNLDFVPLDPLNLIHFPKKCPPHDRHNVYRVMAIIGFIVYVLYLAMTFMVVRIGNQVIYTSWLLAIVVGTIGTIVAEVYVLNLFLIAIAASGSACCCAIHTIVTDEISTKYRGLALSLILFTGEIGGICGHLVVGKWFFASCQNLLITSFSFLLTCTPAIFLLMQDRNNKLVNWL